MGMFPSLIFKITSCSEPRALPLRKLVATQLCTSGVGGNMVLLKVSEKAEWNTVARDGASDGVASWIS